MGSHQNGKIHSRACNRIGKGRVHIILLAVTIKLFKCFTKIEEIYSRKIIKSGGLNWAEWGKMLFSRARSEN